ncbi:hypothetical protein DW886_15780 [Enterocloster aldenensis]|uniref:DUF1281 family ferredoxin-like fold protein n=1 Tax=Enterocloster aldenensis TaxID=358742 RepID=UPI000E4B95AE|nr:hypothetical protein DW886_15780 [Enterocloster aldenensis]
MSNCVYNKIAIEGGFKGLDIFTDKNIDFNKIIPEPKYIEGKDDIINWRENNWNVFRNASGTQIVGSNIVLFETDCNVPINIIKQLSEIANRKIEISWATEGMDGNVGKITFMHGLRISGGLLVPYTDEWKQVMMDLDVYMGDEYYNI